MPTPRTTDSEVEALQRETIRMASEGFHKTLAGILVTGRLDPNPRQGLTTAERYSIFNETWSHCKTAERQLRLKLIDIDSSNRTDEEKAEASLAVVLEWSAEYTDWSPEETALIFSEEWS